MHVPFAKLICHHKSKYAAGYIISIIFDLKYFHIYFKDDTLARGIMGLGYKFVWFYSKKFHHVYKVSIFPVFPVAILMERHCFTLDIVFINCNTAVKIITQLVHDHEYDNTITVN